MSVWKKYFGKGHEMPASEKNEIDKDRELSDEEHELEMLLSERNLRSLPRWAVVAFCVRCARRFQPLLLESFSEIPKQHVAAIDEAISIAEKATITGRNPTVDIERINQVLDTISESVSNEADLCKNVVEGIVNSAQICIEAAISPSRKWKWASASGYSSAGIYFTALAEDLFWEEDDDTNSNNSAVRSDLDILKATSKANHWTDDTPVPDGFFGNIWPKDCPQGWLF